MKHKTHILMLSILFFLLAGCGVKQLPHPKGGSFDYEKTVTTTDIDDKTGTTTTIVEKTTARGLQPESPEHPTTFRINKRGEIELFLPSAGRDAAPSPTDISIGNLIFWAGIIMLAGGALGALINIKLGIGIFAAGGATILVVMMIDAAVKTSATFLGIALGGVAIAGIIILGVMAYNHFRTQKVLRQTKKSIDEAKKDPNIWARLKPILEENQDEDVKQFIKKNQI